MLHPPINADDHIRGDAQAPVILVEYGDYECPHCGRAHPIVERVQKHFGSRLAMVFRNFPLTEMHPNAQAAAETAEIAAVHGHFWDMHDGLFENQTSLGPRLYVQLATEFGIPVSAMQASLSSGEFAPRIRSDFIGGVRSGVNGTPTFFINGERHDGPFEYEDLVAAIDARLGGA